MRGWQCIAKFLTFHLFWNFAILVPKTVVISDNSATDTIELVLLLPWTEIDDLGERTAGGFLVALEDIQSQAQNYPFLQKYKLEWSFINTKCSESYDLVSQVIKKFSVYQSVLIGVSCRSMCLHLVQLAASFNLPFLSFGCMQRALSDHSRFPSFFRTASQIDLWLVNILHDILVTFKWQQVVFVQFHDNQLDLSLKYLYDELMSRSTAENKLVIKLEAVTRNNVNLMDLLDDSYIIIMLEYDRPSFHGALLQYYDLSLLNRGELVFIFLNYVPTAEDRLKLWYNETKLPTLKNVLGKCNILSIDFVYDSSDMAVITKFKTRAFEKHKETRFGGLLKPQYDFQISHMAAYLYEAVMLFASLMNIVYAKHKAYNGSQFASSAFELHSYPGVGKKTTFNRDTYTGKTMYGLNFYGLGNYTKQYRLGLYSEEGKLLKVARGKSKRALDKDAKMSIVWPEGRMAPLGSPSCGWDRSNCDLMLLRMMGIMVGICLVVIILIITVGLLILHRHVRSQAESRDISEWIHKYEDVVHLSKKTSSLALMEGGSTLGPSDSYQGSQKMSTASFGSGSFVTMSENDTESIMHQQIFAHIGFVGGTAVAIKRLYISEIEKTDNNLIADIQEIAKINHENLNEFIGICIRTERVCLLVAYTQKGSLHDVLLNEKFNLTWDFRFSLATDAAKGMEYLHNSSLGSHGHLTSSNCLVDSRWICKVTDYGMGNVKKMQKLPDEQLTKYYDMLWTAPELLRTSPDERPMYGTKEGDVYSYGIIMQEIAIRDEPYAALLATMEAEVMVNQVMVLEDPPFRPVVPASTCSQQWIDLMQECWHETPTVRPPFSKILKSMVTISGHKTMNVIDNMLHMLERHAEHLEDLVKERQAQLDEEKKKVEMLLCNMLPKTTVEKLTNGEKALPELFEMATIFFSDIIDFLELASNSTPLQTVDFLNSVYALIDDVTDKFDAYKVETINDEYLVASGLPIRNSHHANEIATMSLVLLNSCSSFVIPHLPNEVLKLRIGVHSGPVVAGVIGFKMPRYCVFGDTVNTASRMKSSGLALKIHVSAATFEQLEKSGEFHLTKRGPIEVKGKGLMNTYWVTGKNSFRLTLPVIY